MALAKQKKQDHSKPRQASFMPSAGPAIGLPSPLGSVMSGQKTPGRARKDMNSPLLLTALVDAFSILVIFLLVQVSGAPSAIEANDTIKLPTASSIEAADGDLESRIANLVVTDRGYILNERPVSAMQLKAELKQLKLETGKPVRLVIQADNKSDFDVIAPLLALTAEAGVSKLEFAVEQVDAAAGSRK
jgi:biopolymer transport protein ExbD